MHQVWCAAIRCPISNTVPNIFYSGIIALVVIIAVRFIKCSWVTKCNWVQNISNKLINKDLKQLAVFVSQHFSKLFVAHY
ncbi:hypothetical protein C7Y70_02415 [Pseudoalteromonas sp. KS88]|nr:hypothetical protein C7Y70_02415 [Pseudoalteromonas sp. KS88]